MDPTPLSRRNTDRPALERSRSFSELQLGLRTWRRLPTITAFKRVDDETVKVESLEHTLYSDAEQRRAWQGAFFVVNKRVRSLSTTVELADSSRFRVGRAQFAKLDNWTSTVPLPLVLLEYDRLWTDNVHGANTRSTIAFASLLRSLGLVKGSGWWGSLCHWLEQHAAVALALWVAMFEFYSRTRSMALEAGEDWAHKLSALELHGESPGWHAYLQQLGLERAGDGGRPPQLYPHRANFFLGNEVAVEPTFTDLYVALHDDKEALLGEAASEHVAQSSPHRVMARKVWGYVPDVFKPKSK